jgi:uncharacterized protein (TIGR03663 family)
MWHVRAAWLAIVAAALAFRIPALRERPMHADEAVLADKFGGLLETGTYPYDPQQYHGPALAWLTVIPARLMGARRYSGLTETTLRIVPALCGVALVLLPLLLSGGLGRWGVAAAAALTAVSPAMVYYSRYYIPEMLLTTLTLAAIVCGYRYSRSGAGAWAIAAGVSMGLMFVTKETAAIDALCMLIALAVTIRQKPARLWHWLAAAGIATLIPIAALGLANCWRAAMSYSERGLHAAAHHHPWYYYLSLVGWQHLYGGPVWTGGLILVLALAEIAVVASRRTGPNVDVRLLRFLAVYAPAMMLAYSLIPYKTPWCILGPLHAMILLAGAGVIAVLQALRPPARIAVAAMAAVLAAHLGFQAWRASFPFSSDPRNPYAYAPTLADVYEIRDGVEKLAGSHPNGHAMPIQVISGQNMWPLPWYFRDFPRIEWWRRLGPGFRPADVILVTTDLEPALAHEIYEVPPPGKRELYLPIFDRLVELRPNVELRGYVRASLAR